MVKLRGIIINVQRTSEKKMDPEGVLWEKCIVEVELTGLSKRARAEDEDILKEFYGKRVKIIRWCALDWHCMLGKFITLDPDEIRSLQKQ